MFFHKFIGAALSVMVVTAAAGPNALPMGIEVVERDGKTIVREVPHELLGREPETRCRECVGQGGQCTVGDGSCFKEDPPLFCTFCGECGSVCVREGQTCEQTCI